MQRLLRPLDHVPDSHGSAGRAQSADSLRGPLQTIPAREEEYGTEQLGRIGGFSLQQLQGHSITYCIAMGPQAGRKVLTVQTIPAWEEDDQANELGCVQSHWAKVVANASCRTPLALRALRRFYPR